MAAFYANRLERPEVIRKSFEAALERFPSNGRLHLTYSEWLLTPRPTAPYRAFRAEDESLPPEAERELALTHIDTALGLEPELTREALRMLLRFRVPEPIWAERLPPTDETLQLVLETVDRTEANPEARRSLLQDSLARGSALPLFRSIAYYAERWGETTIALDAAGRWRRAALDEGASGEIVKATTAAARLHLAANDGDRAYELTRSTISLVEERGLPSETTLVLLCNVGDEYLNRGQTAMAQGLFSEAAAISRFHVPAVLGLARAYRAAGDLASARSELERALALDPSNETARRQLDEIAELPLRSPER
jgi:Tetratricopeptide repeat